MSTHTQGTNAGISVFVSFCHRFSLYIPLLTCFHTFSFASILYLYSVLNF